MSLFGFFKSRKKKKNKAAAGNEPGEGIDLSAVDLSGIEEPETRYTQEYRDFLASGEIVGKGPSEGENSETLE